MFKRISLLLAILAMTTVMSGCFHQRVVVDSKYDAAKSMPDYQTNYFHVVGLVGISNQVALNEVCSSGAGIVENKTILFIGFVAMQQLAVYCK